MSYGEKVYTPSAVRVKSAATALLKEIVEKSPKLDWQYERGLSGVVTCKVGAQSITVDSGYSVLINGEDYGMNLPGSGTSNLRREIYNAALKKANENTESILEEVIHSLNSL